MATIVRQAKDPWWTPLAVNVLGGLWNKWQENEANRKANAFKGQLAQDLAALTGGTQQNGLTDSTQGNIFNMQNEPEGYNADGWGRAFHNTDSPLTQFDFGTNNIVPQNAAPQNTAVQNAAPRSLTAMDIYNAAMLRAAQKRFSHLSPQSINDIVNPYIKMNEDAKQERRRQEAADAYLNAGNDIERLNQLFGSTINGVTPTDILKLAQERYNHDNPPFQQYSHNAGDRTYFGSYNPRTGQYNQAGEFANVPTPLELMRLGEQGRQFGENMAFNREVQRIQQERWNREFERNSQPTYTIQAMGDGKMYWVDPHGGKITPVINSNGEHMSALQSGAGTATLSDAEKAYFKEAENMANGLRKEISALQRSRERAYENEKPEIDRQIKAKQDELNRLNAERDAMLRNMLTRSAPRTQNQTTQTQQTSDNNTRLVGAGMDIGANMINHANNGYISTHFGAPRTKKDGTKYSHAGMDLPAPKDTPIRLDDVGTVMTVTKVTNDANGYGNYVDLEGTLTDKDGKQHTISLRLAHMGDGTVNVKQGQQLRYGDLIGKVGNTGNSRGKNGGYHLHIETRIDGVLKNPAEFRGLIEGYIPYSKTIKPEQSNIPIPDRNTRTNSRPVQSGSEVLWRNPKTGDVITRADEEYFYREADAGKLPYAGSSKALPSYWMTEGFERVGNNANNSGTQAQNTNSNATPIQVTQTSPDVTILGSADRHIANQGITSPDLNTTFQSPDMSQAMTSPSVFPERSPEMQAALANLNGDNNEGSNSDFSAWNRAARQRYPLWGLSSSS